MYLALARKYRPQQFKDLIGQPHITKTLQNAIQMNKLYPTLIFSGMKGVGKTSVSRILAKALNCQHGPAEEPCNQCQFCLEITEDKAPDYIEIDGASNNGVEEVRNLRERVKYKPLKNKFRVVVIDEVHMLSNSAWNALLKTIEEPPPHTYFIMATTDFHKIPATIVSRCQHFEFKRISYDLIADLLQQICQKENITVTEYALFLIARASEGSLRDAQKILDQSLAIANGNITDKDVIELLGVIEEGIFIKLIKYIVQQQRQGIIEMVADLSDRGVDQRYFFNEFLKFLSELIIFKAIENPGKLSNLNPENIKEISDILKNTSEIQILRYFNAAKEMEFTMRNTENPRIMLEYLLVKLSFFPQLLPIEKIIERLGDAPLPQPAAIFVPSAKTEVFGPANPSDQLPVNPIAKPNVQPNDCIMDGFNPNWQKQLSERLNDSNPRLASVLEAALFSFTPPDNLKISVDEKMGHMIAFLEENRSIIESQLNAVSSTNFILQFGLTKISTNDQEMIEKLRNDKQVNNLVDKIKGKIITIEKV